MDKIKQKAKELLESNKVQVVIGYEEGTAGKTRPVFITNAKNTDKLIFDDRCYHNLAVYLTKVDVKKMGRVAVVASLNTLKSIVKLSSEHQVAFEDIDILGVDRSGELHEFASMDDVLNYIHQNPVEYSPEEKSLLQKIESMTMEERWEFWQDQFSRCIKCYACRAACPNCYCDRCIVDINQPQWIPTTSDNIGNLEWHIVRAMHLAGRCVNCGACADACPVNIPLNLLTLKMTEEINKDFGASDEFTLTDYPLSIYNSNDKENFIK